MYFPFFQREHKVHHHILSAGLFALIGIHAYLGVDALLAGPTVMQKTGKIAVLERQTQSYKELAREARKLIISSKKKGKILKLSEAMNMIKTGAYSGSGVRSNLMKSTSSGISTKSNDETLSFSSAPENEQSANEIFANKINKKRTTTQTGVTTPPAPTNNSTPIYTGGGGSSGGSSSSSSPTQNTTVSPQAVITSTSQSAQTATGITSSGSTSTGNTNISSGATVSTGTTTISSGSSAPQTQAPTTTGTTSPQTSTTNSTALPISGTENPQLKKLSDYQKVVGGFVTNQLMVFLNMPESSANIEGASYYIANTANEFAKYGITPIFIIEPYGDNGQLDLGKIKNGDYVAKLDSLFALLKGARGLSEEKLGILVPYPEINTPAFQRTNFTPTDLPILVNQYFDVVRKYYPNARGGLLLDGKSYNIGKTWGQGEYTSYSPYISGIKPGYISYFGIQGFPWVSNDGTDTFYDPNVFLPISLAKEAANTLSIKNIWFNTGTMKKSYTSNTVYTSTADRQNMIDGIISQGNNLLGDGYNVFINIFAENKFSLGEGIDWSYIESASDGVITGDEGVIQSFVSQARESGIQTSLFDM